MKMRRLPLILVVLTALILGGLQWKQNGKLKATLANIQSKLAFPAVDEVPNGSAAQGSDAKVDVKFISGTAAEVLAKAAASVRPGFLTSPQWQEIEAAVFSVPLSELPQLLDDLLGNGTKNLNSSIVAAIFERWGQSDREAALERIESLPESLRNSAFQGVVTSWAEEGPEAALTFAEEMQSKDPEQSSLTRTVIETVAASDFEKAIGLAGDNLSSVALAVRVWGTRDPKSALEWLVSQGDGDGTRLGVMGELIGRVAARDPDEALALARSLDGIDKSTALGAVIGQLATKDFAAASEELLGALDGEGDRIRLLDEFANFLEGVDPGDLLDLAEQLPADVARDQFLREAVWKVSDSKAAAALASMIGHEGTFEAALSGVLKEWGVADPVAASEFLHDLEASPAKDAAIKSFTTGLLREDPEAAVLWAGSMDNAEARDKQVIHLLEHWHVRDREAASAWTKANRDRIPKPASRER